jgi:putative hydrolase of the HAD superfamily
MGVIYKHLFFDLDHTIWDFDTNAKQSMQELYETLNLKSLGINDFEAFYKAYIHYNDLLWERYRKGFIKQDELRWKRMFKTLLDFKIGNEVLAKDMSAKFLDLLPTRNAVFPHTYELLDYLQAKNYELHLITNGFVEVQHNKLKHANLAQYFNKVITSQESNSLKPNREIFEYALKQTGASIVNSIMIGDNLDADIRGAANFGMHTIWVNHLNNDTSPHATYTVYDLKSIMEFL